MNTATIRKHLDTIETANVDVGRFAMVLDIMSHAMMHMESHQHNTADIGDSLQAISHAIDGLYNTVFDAKEAIESEIRQASL